MSETKKEPIELILCLSKAFEGFVRSEMKANGIKISYRHLLHPLAQKDGVTQLDLVKISKLKAPTVSTTLRNMELEGLVTRETDKDDARATRVFITEKGKEIDAKMCKSIDKAASLMLDGIPAQSKNEAVSFLKKVAENVRKNNTVFVSYDD